MTDREFTPPDESFDDELKIRLIALVEERPVIWKAQSDDLKLKDERMALADIASLLNSEFRVQYDGSTVAREFKKLKYSYSRAKAAGKTGEGVDDAKRRKNAFRYTAEMRFLQQNEHAMDKERVVVGIVLVNRFRILRSPLGIDPDNARNLIVAIGLLQNYLRSAKIAQNETPQDISDADAQDMLPISPPTDDSMSSRQLSQEANEILISASYSTTSGKRCGYRKTLWIQENVVDLFDVGLIRKSSKEEKICFDLENFSGKQAEGHTRFEVQKPVLSVRISPDGTAVAVATEDLLNFYVPVSGDAYEFKLAQDWSPAGNNKIHDFFFLDDITSPRQGIDGNTFWKHCVVFFDNGRLVNILDEAWSVIGRLKINEITQGDSPMTLQQKNCEPITSVL
ncbi:hypothetical protein QR680_009057 [Steinernema hermaphroditum]|uniref:MADF domain-containing protein n=1 Tax=Steinernema hermaphroditum TaxID=289476 RepID=A0AA39M862_9BILA|nr:hypothetical protein QR680_009057 [Steinernema hermaphroditum]